MCERSRIEIGYERHEVLMGGQEANRELSRRDGRPTRAESLVFLLAVGIAAAIGLFVYAMASSFCC